MVQAKKMMLITTCSKSKTRSSQVFFKQGETFDTLDNLSSEWCERIQNASQKTTIPLSTLYAGRGFKKVQALSEIEDAAFWIISSGLGFVPHDYKAVAYNLTTSIGAPNHVKNYLSVDHFSPSKWWESINLKLRNNPTPIKSAILTNTDTIFVLAISRAYGEMIASDIGSLDPSIPEEAEALSRLRIIGSDLESVLPPNLFDAIMPYDERLNKSNKMFTGGRIDFPQRALTHFLQNVDLSKDVLLNAQEVSQLMNDIADISELEHLKKERASNEYLRTIVANEYAPCFGRFVRMLQKIRNHYQISCSENRLKVLLDELQAEAAEEGSTLIDYLKNIPSEL